MKNFLTATAMAAMVLAGMSARGLAQGSIIVQPGETIVCTIECEGHVVVAGTTVNASASGEAEFVSVELVEGPIISTSFQPVTLTVSGTDPVYGNYTFQLDGSRSVSNTVVTANQPGSEFPATADVYANVTGTVAGLTGTFTNDSPCHMRALNVNSFNPQINVRYQFVNDVSFSNEQGETWFTIPAGAEVTLN